MWIVAQVINPPLPPTLRHPLRLEIAAQDQFLISRPHDGIARLANRAKAWPKLYRLQHWPMFAGDGDSIEGTSDSNKGTKCHQCGMPTEACNIALVLYNQHSARIRPHRVFPLCRGGSYSACDLCCKTGVITQLSRENHRKLDHARASHNCVITPGVTDVAISTTFQPASPTRGALNSGAPRAARSAMAPWRSAT